MCQFQLQDNYFLQQNKHFLATESILFTKRFNNLETKLIHLEILVARLSKKVPKRSTIFFYWK